MTVDTLQRVAHEALGMLEVADAEQRLSGAASARTARLRALYDDVVATLQEPAGKERDADR